MFARLFRRIAPRSIYDVMAAIACFGVLAGGTAYAANTIRSGDIVDNEVTTTDVRDDTLGFGGLLSQDLAAGSVRSSEVQDDSLTGTDVNESTLNLSSATTATFAYPPNPVELSDNPQTFTKVAGRNVAGGAWAVTGTVSTSAQGAFSGGGNTVRDTFCELRNGSGFIGGTADRRVIPEQDHVYRSLAMTGGAQVPAGGGEVSLWCRSQDSTEKVEGAQVMMIRIGGFS
jgi:hypothetical protein